MIVTLEKKTTGKHFISLLSTTLHYTVNTDTDTVTHRHTYMELHHTRLKCSHPAPRSYRLTSNNPSARHGKLPFESLVSRIPRRLPEECRLLPLSLVASHNLKARLNRCVLQIQDLKESSCIWPGSLLLKDQALLFHDICSGSQGRETINTPSSTEKPTEGQ